MTSPPSDRRPAAPLHAAPWRAALLALCLGVAGPALGASLSTPLVTAKEAGASLWSAGLHSGVRLLDGGAGPDGRTLAAGIEIRLDPHYKTYWRTPGDSGVPPDFDWSASSNVRSVSVSWPVPIRYQDAAGTSIGYKDRLLLPLAVTPEDPSRPVVLDLRLDYAVCEQICIPAHGEMRLPLGGSRLSTPQAARIAAAMAEVPAPAALSASDVPGIAAATPAPDGAAVLVEARVPDGTGPVDLFLEGPENWAFSAPEAIDTRPTPGGRRVTYRIGVDGRPDKAVLKDLPVTLTLVAGDHALEVATRLDGAAPAP